MRWPHTDLVLVVAAAEYNTYSLSDVHGLC